MSIVRLCKITLVGTTRDKQEVLDGLQKLGCAHIIPLTKTDAGTDTGTSTQGRAALKFLLGSPHRFPQVTRKPEGFDPEQIERDVLALRARIDALTAERDELRARIAERRPWGDFKPPRADELRGKRLWLYQIPNHQRDRMKASDLCAQVVAHDDHYDYLAVISEHEPPPDALPVPPIKSDDRSLSELEHRLQDLELALVDVQAERARLTRWCLLLGRSMDHLDDLAAVALVNGQTRDLDNVFALQAWIPDRCLADLRTFAAERDLVLEAVQPDPGEIPPTQYHNPEHIAGGEELVAIYMTPSYWLCDPSPVVFFSFALFFAVMMCDAGYGVLLSIFTAAMWKRLGQSPVSKRWRMILAWASGLTIIYGVMAGSYFGIEPRAGVFKKLHILNTKNYGQMMLLSALTGVVHLTLANLMNAWRYGRSVKLLAPLGWAAIMVGGSLLILGPKAGLPAGAKIGEWMLIAGALLVVLFTAADATFGKRLLGGVLGLTRLTSAFGDVLSYLRLYALGLASGALAAVFNTMAGGLYRRYAGLGLLFAIVLAVFGHTINLLLGISSGFIHGLRLNLIEFFNWGVQEEGTVYRPFARKETEQWKG